MTPDQYYDLEADNKGELWTEQEYEVLYEYLNRNGKFEFDELTYHAQKILEESTLKRTIHGVKFQLQGMHCLVFGKFPVGIVLYETGWYAIPHKLEAYCKDLGYDVEMSIVNMKADMKERIRKNENRKTPEEARLAMAQYFKENKQYLPSAKEMSQYREEIIAMLEAGEDEVYAFNKALGVEEAVAA